MATSNDANKARKGLRVIPEFTLEEHRDGKVILHPPGVAITWPDAEEAQGWVDRKLARIPTKGDTGKPEEDEGAKE